MRILIDTREPWPHPWAPYFPAEVKLERGTVPTGDVTLAAIPEGAVVERKEKFDFLAAIGRERKRFELELKRARYLGAFVIIVEATMADVLLANRQRGQLSDEAIFGTVATWTRRGAPVLFAGTVHAAADLAYRFLTGQVREIERAAKAVQSANGPAPESRA